MSAMARGKANELLEGWEADRGEGDEAQQSRMSSGRPYRPHALVVKAELTASACRSARAAAPRRLRGSRQQQTSRLLRSSS